MSGTHSSVLKVSAGNSNRQLAKTAALNETNSIRWDGRPMGTEPQTSTVGHGVQDDQHGADLIDLCFHVDRHGLYCPTPKVAPKRFLPDGFPQPTCSADP